MNCIACKSGKIETFKFPDGNIYSCRSCRLQWADCRHPNKEEFSKDAVFLRFHSPDSIDILQYTPYKQFSSFIDRQYGQQKHLSILDVGCGNGNFLKWAISLGHKCRGVEINEKFREVIPGDVLPYISFIPVEQYKLESDTKFDVITLWDCAEHLSDPFRVINHLKRYLSPGGIVYIRVNNRRDIYNFATDVLLTIWPRVGLKVLRRCFGFNHVPNAHLWNFSYKGMYELLKINGWKILEHNFSETPAKRLTANKILYVVIQVAYLVNFLLRGGRIGNYFITAEIDNH